jgi:hypothetical protein
MFTALITLLRTRFVALVTTQLAFLFAYLVGKGWIDQANADATVRTLANAGVIVVFAIAHQLLLSPTGKWLISLLEKVLGVDLDGDGNPPAAPPVAGLIIVLAIGGATVGTACLPGCGLFAAPTATTPQEDAIRRVTVAQGMYQFAVNTITQLHAKGEISDSTMKVIVPIEQTVYDYLTAATTAANENRLVDTNEQLKLFFKALDHLTEIYGGTPAPTTQPG